MRIDVAFRVGPSTSLLRVRYPAGSGAYQDVSLTHGLYVSAAALAAEIDAKLNAIAPELGCTNSGATFVLSASSGLFDLQLPQPSLRLHLGQNSASLTNRASVTGTCPGVFVSQYPWDTASVTLVQTRKISLSPRGVPRVVGLSHWREHQIQALVQEAELASLRPVLSKLLQGATCTLYRSAGVTAAWSWSQLDGASVVVLTSGSRAYSETFETAPATCHVSVPLTFREVS